MWDIIHVQEKGLVTPQVKKEKDERMQMGDDLTSLLALSDHCISQDPQQRPTAGAIRILLENQLKKLDTF